MTCGLNLEIKNHIIGIVARDQNGLIGYTDGSLPWNCRGDLRRFKQHTTEMKCPIIIGRKTFESLPLRVFAEGDTRQWIVLTRHPEKINIPYKNVKVMQSVDEVLALKETNSLCIAGGAEIYALFEPYVHIWHVFEPNPDQVSQCTDREPVYLDIDLDHCVKYAGPPSDEGNNYIYFSLKHLNENTLPEAGECLEYPVIATLG